MAMNEVIKKAGRLQGTLNVPGDKSIAHRALILGSLAEGTQVVRNLPPSADVASTAACLRALGCAVIPRDDQTLEVVPGPWNRDTRLDAGNSGTTTRLLSGLVAGAGLRCVFDGDESLRRRPMRRIAAPLEQMGATVKTSPHGGLPMEIRGAALQGITHAPDVASAQVKSAVLIAGLLASGTTTVIEKAPTRDHTERMLEAMGAEVTKKGTAVTVTGGEIVCKARSSDREGRCTGLT